MDKFRAKVRKSATDVLDTKEKSRYNQYGKFVNLSTHGKQQLKLETSNNMRVSGMMLIYQMLLLSYWDIHYYVQSDDAPDKLKNLAPTMEEWEMMTNRGCATVNSATFIEPRN